MTPVALAISDELTAIRLKRNAAERGGVIPWKSRTQ